MGMGKKDKKDKKDKKHDDDDEVSEEELKRKTKRRIRKTKKDKKKDKKDKKKKKDEDDNSEEEEGDKKKDKKDEKKDKKKDKKDKKKDKKKKGEDEEDEDEEDQEASEEEGEEDRNFLTDMAGKIIKPGKTQGGDAQAAAGPAGLMGMVGGVLGGLGGGSQGQTESPAGGLGGLMSVVSAAAPSVLGAFGGAAVAQQGHAPAPQQPAQGQAYPPAQQGAAYPSQQGQAYPPQQGGTYPQQGQGQVYPQGGAYPPQQGAYPPQQGAAYPPQQGQGQAYPPQQGSAYPPQQGAAYPPQQGGSYPPANPQGAAYPPQQGGAYPPQQGGAYPPQQSGTYPPQGQGQGYPPQQGYSGGAGGSVPQQNAHQVSPEVLALYKTEPGEPPLPPPTVTGTRKAVIVGINYIGHAKGQLKGCIPDANNVEQFLLTHGFPPQNIKKLTDDNPNAMPTKANMISAMKWLVSGAQPGDSLFFHYSGHGGQEADKTMLEEDGLNETVIPFDYPTAGQIPDDDIHKLLAKSLPAGVRLTAIFDSCHSGTIMDLPYIYHSTEKAYQKAHKSEDSGFMKRHKIGFSSLTSLAGIASTVTAVAGSEILYQGKKKTRQEILEKLNTTKAMVMQISGCRDEQTSADTSALSGGATGAMSYAFISTMNQNPNQTWKSLIKNMRDCLHNGPKKFTQMPQLNMGRLVSPDLPVLF